MDYEQILLDTQISADSPGTILRDFNTLLEFIGTEGIETSGKFHLIPIKHLNALNARLCQPLDLDLKRPLQKSYPPIQGLYLLLRGSGMGQLRPRGKKTYLCVDAASLAAWQQLKPAEQYFSLLEVWLCYIDTNLVGEHSSRGIPESLMYLRDFCRRVAERPLDLDQEEPHVRGRLIYFPGMFQLALMRLFGLLEVADGPPETGGGWSIQRITLTPFGGALSWRLCQDDVSNAIIGLSEPDEDVTWSRWFMAKFRPLFPELENPLELPGSEHPAQALYTLKVTLPGYAFTGRLQLSGETLLDALSNAILDMVEFDDDHLYGFYYQNRRGQTCEISHPFSAGGPFDEGYPLSDETTLHDLELSEQQTFTYLFDFGDEWHFQLTVENIDDSHTMAEGEVKLLDVSGEPPLQYG